MPVFVFVMSDAYVANFRLTLPFVLLRILSSSDPHRIHTNYYFVVLTYFPVCFAPQRTRTRSNRIHTDFYFRLLIVFLPFTEFIRIEISNFFRFILPFIFLRILSSSNPRRIHINYYFALLFISFNCVNSKLAHFYIVTCSSGCEFRMSANGSTFSLCSPNGHFAVVVTSAVSSAWLVFPTSTSIAYSGTSGSIWSENEINLLLFCNGTRV